MASVAKRKWKGPDGGTKEAWAVRYFDEKGVRRGRTFTLKKDADNFKRKVEREIEDGIHTPDKATKSVTEVCDEFMRHQDIRLAEKRLGRARYVLMRGAVENYFKPNIGRKKIAHLTFADVDALRSAIGAAGVAPITVSQYLFLFKQVEDFARKRGLTKLQVTTDVCREHGGLPRERVRTPTMDEVKAILSAVEDRGAGRKKMAHSVLRCAIHIAAFCGLRFGEIMGLTLDAIDMEGGFIRVRNNLTAWDEHKGTKTRAGVRDVPMPPHIGQMILEHAEQFPSADPRGLVFRSAAGTAIQASAFHRDRWRPLLKKAGVAQDGKRLHFHALRHFAASSYIDQGLPLTDVTSLIGHSAFDMTLQVYAHPIVGGNRRSEAVNRMATQLYLPAA